MQRHFEQERERFVATAQERAAAWGELLQRSLPGAEAPPEDQAAALRDWSERLRLPLALDDAMGRRIGASEGYLRREFDDLPGAASRAAGAAGGRAHAVDPALAAA